MTVDMQVMRDELTRDEGSRLRLYKDSVGKFTIGVGRNLDDRGITKDEEALMLSNDIRNVIDQLNANMSWWQDLDSVRQRVMVNMCFNLGYKKFSGFANTLSAIREARYDDAATEMRDSVWAGQVGVRAERLAQMMETGHS